MTAGQECWVMGAQCHDGLGVGESGSCQVGYPVGAPYLPPPGEDGSSSDAQNGRLRRGRSAEVFEQTQPYFWGNGETKAILLSHDKNETVRKCMAW